MVAAAKLPTCDSENWGPDRLPDIEALWRTACPEETIGLDDLRTVLVDGGGSVVAEVDGGGSSPSRRPR